MSNREYDLYKQWAARELEDCDLNEELAAIKDDTDAIEDRFYRDLEFGTGGLRGVIGAGTNRMNIYTVRRATQGIADYLNEAYDAPGVAISYDSRIKSDLFARESARVFAANGIRVHIYPELMPTPCLSYAVRALGCQAGAMLTASHNPAKYNGYKVYGADGCQMTLDAAEKVLQKILQVDIFHGVKLTGYDEAVGNGMISLIGEDVAEAYLQQVRAQAIHPEATANTDLKVVYTPLNGTGNKPVRRILEMAGVQNVIVVPEQEKPDGTFKTCPFPNPEIKEALALGLALCEQEKPDLLLATDPDCDRMGMAVPDKNGEYVLISGNEAGALLFEYICHERTAQGTMPQNPVAVKTIVSTAIADKIAQRYGVEIRNVLTGFKFIGEQIGFLEEKGEDDRFIFGFEESYGYLAGSYVRDKDGVVASMLVCEMAAFYKQQGISILDALGKIYETYGVYCHSQSNFICEGAAGMEKMAEMMSNLRENPPKSIGGYPVERYTDYANDRALDCRTGKTEPTGLPKSDVLAYALAEGQQVILRPSGTEPKIKAYYTATAPTRAEAEQIAGKLQADFTGLLGF